MITMMMMMIINCFLKKENERKNSDAHYLFTDTKPPQCTVTSPCFSNSLSLDTGHDIL